MSTVIEDGPSVISIVTDRRKGTYRDVIERVAEIEKIGTWFARSQLFGCSSEAQGCAIAIECILTGITPIEYAKRNKIVANKPFQQYDSMLASFRERGGESKILESTPEGARIWLKDSKKEVTTSLTWQELESEPVVYAGRESEVIAMLAAGQKPTLKPKYATPLSRKTMILARLVSATMRAHFPEICYGTYTPEEIDDIKDEEEVVETPKPATRRVDSRVVDTKPEVSPGLPVPGTPYTIETPPPVTAAPLTGPALEAQTTRIKELMAEIAAAGESDISAKVKSKLASHGLAKLADLSIAEADLMINALATRNAKLWFDASLAGHASVPQ